MPVVRDQREEKNIPKGNLCSWLEASGGSHSCNGAIECWLFFLLNYVGIQLIFNRNHWSHLGGHGVLGISLGSSVHVTEFFGGLRKPQKVAGSGLALGAIGLSAKQGITTCYA